jgi:hypothetical protein
MFSDDARASTVVELEEGDNPQWLVMVPSNVVRGHQNYIPVAFVKSQREAEDIRMVLRESAFCEPKWF